MSVLDVGAAARLQPQFQWQRMRIAVVSVTDPPAHAEHPLAIFDAMVRQAKRGLSLGPVIIRTPEQRGQFKLRRGARFVLELLLTGADAKDAEAFARAFRERIYGFAIDGEIAIDEVLFAPRELPADDEVCMWFRTALPVRSKKGRLRLGAADLSRLIGARIAAIFGTTVFPPVLLDVRVLTHFSRYTRFQHKAKSSPGNVWLDGHIGPILVRGSLRDLWPWLCLCEQLGIGNQLGFGLGQFTLEAPSPRILTARWADQDRLAHVAEDVVERYDRAGAELAAESAIPFDAHALAAALGDELAGGHYTPSPHQAFVIQKNGGGRRRVEFPAFRDLVVANHLKGLLEEPLDNLFEPSSLGFRKGHSQQEAAARIDAAIAEGFEFVVESDIEDFFPSVDHDRLERLLKEAVPASDAALVDAVMRLVRTGYSLDGKEYGRERGLAQGSPLSPLLANLYLNAFDETMEELGAHLVRYADDFVILTRTRAEAEALLHTADERIQSIGLHLKVAKTRVTAVAEGFSFLGIHFPRGPAGEQPALAVHGRKPLYVTERGIFLAIAGDAVVVRKEGTVLDSIPLRRVSDIFVFGYGAISNGLLRRCADFDVPVSFCVADGYHVNTVAPNSRLFFDVSFRQAVRYYQLTDAERLEIARMIVHAKVSNSQALFRQRHNEHTALAVAELGDALARVRDASDLSTLRGLEGMAARKAFAHWAGLIDAPGFPFANRAREHPDRVNSLLNFGYHLLFSRLNVVVRGLGLNPYLGFLHEPGDRYETLVCDLQEPFRANVDRLILTLINQRTIKPEDFRETPRGVRLAGDGFRGFILAFERMLARPPRTGASMTAGAALYAQALSMKRYLCEGQTLRVYRWQDNF